MTQAEFARRSNCSQTTVSKALRAGRLALLADGGIDPRFLEKQWRAQPVHTKAANASSSTDRPAKKVGRPPKKPVEPASAERVASFAAAALQKERALAGLRELEYQQRAGALISLDAAKRVLFEAARGARDGWLSWPSRVAPLLAARLGIAPDVVLHELTALVREQCACLGEPAADFGARES
ncbi:hypothetical protein P5W99_30020 [Paraburkholderia sp. A3BS-1L]|uniref:hypothetical protein n=1 Tax=Paraburkholderia sp. A3BS-1L TaxID=3028375 RepID=UPI003DAA0212